ncbi:MAG: excinuclease ABC subunit UvrB, partial [Beijerinckiaceae bacterium]|nr:excinuclease ABC subunit UvrB [Beijerinckiaceae bacterium]
MAKTTKTPSGKSTADTTGVTKKTKNGSSGKASRPDVHPLGDHLASLLNPALVEKRQEPRGFGEAPQAGFDSGPVTGLDAKLADQFGLDPTGDLDFTTPKPKRARPQRGQEVIGSTATSQSLQNLLEAGDPNLREKKPWAPHRPPRPEKSEGGIKFKLISEYEPKGDQPNAIAELV